MASTLVLGCTGMVGAHILTTLRQSSPTQISSINIIARRSPPASSGAKISTNEFVEKDTTTWASHLFSLSPSPSIIFSALATTRAAAGSFENQYKLEHDLNIELAKAAKEAGSKVYVLISASGAQSDAFFAYTKMKGEIEENVKALGFDHTVILRPGLIGGYREESRPAEAVIRKIAAFMGGISGNRLTDFWAQDADVIARAAVAAGLQAQRGELKAKVVVLGAKEIISLGRTEWKQ